MTWDAGRPASRSACEPPVSSKRSPSGPGASRHWPPRMASGSWRCCSAAWEASRSCSGASHPTLEMSRRQPGPPPKQLATARRRPGRSPNGHGMAKSPRGPPPKRPVMVKRRQGDRRTGPGRNRRRPRGARPGRIRPDDGNGLAGVEGCQRRYDPGLAQEHSARPPRVGVALRRSPLQFRPAHHQYGCPIRIV